MIQPFFRAPTTVRALYRPLRRASIALVLACTTFAAGANSAALDTGLRAYASGDYQTAYTVLRPWADAGEADAQLALGQMYAEGRGAPQDFVEAHRWYNLAASTGMAIARARRDALAQRMTATQIARAQRLARQWRAGPRPTNRASTTVTTSSSTSDGWSSSSASSARPLPPGNRTARVQTMLSELGYDPGPADGVSGAKTRAAIRSYEAHSGLAVTGLVSSTLHDSLANDLGYDTSSAAASTSSSNYGQSSSSRGHGTQLDRAMRELHRVVRRAERHGGANRETLASLREILSRYRSSPGSDTRSGTGSGAASSASTSSGSSTWRGRDDPTPTTRADALVIHDDFNDGNFHSRPRWEVKRGAFEVDRRGRLRGQINPTQSSDQTSSQSSGNARSNELPLVILEALLGPGTNAQRSSHSSGGQERNTIETYAEIPAKFQFRARLDVGSPAPHVRFVMMPSGDPSELRALDAVFKAGSVQLSVLGRSQAVLGQVNLRFTSSRPTTREFLWRRGRDGTMTVLIDGQPALRLQDSVGNQGFAALRLHHLAGDLALNSVDVSRASGR